MNKLDAVKIENLIFKLRGNLVMLSSDLANLYNCNIKKINELIKNNISNFIPNFCFELTKEEIKNINNLNTKGKKDSKTYYALTDEGIIMLSKMLNTSSSFLVTVKIIRTFLYLNRFIKENKVMLNEKNSIDLNMLENFENLDEIYFELEPQELISNKIFFNGKLYSPYRFVIDLINQARKRIIVIDSCIDKNLFNLLAYRNDNIDVVIVTDKKTLKNFNPPNNFHLKFSRSFNDNYLIIDNDLYLFETSFSNLNNKCF